MPEIYEKILSNSDKRRDSACFNSCRKISKWRDKDYFNTCRQSTPSIAQHGLILWHFSK